MPIPPEEKSAEIAASMLVKEAVEALFSQLNLHSLQVIWMATDPGKTKNHIVSASYASFGCPQCGGGIMAIAVKNLPQEMRATFAHQFLSEDPRRSGMEIVHLSPKTGMVQ